jgi:RNA polymerase sigma-70 factor (ECF subfamily)
MSDNEPAQGIFQRYQAREPAAAEEIYRRYAQRLAALAERQIGDRLRRHVGPDDIVQSVFRTFFRRADNGEFQIDHSNSLWNLLVTITLHKIRKKGRKRELNIAEGVPAEDLAHDPDPQEANVLLDELEFVLAGRKSPEPEIVRLCLQGYSSTEIAQQLGTSRWTVRRVLDRVGKVLERRLLDSVG